MAFFGFNFASSGEGREIPAAQGAGSNGVRHAYFIKKPEGADRESFKKAALDAIFKLNLKKFPVVAYGVKAENAGRDVSDRVYFHGSQGDVATLKGMGFDVHQSPARYPEPSTVAFDLQ